MRILFVPGYACTPAVWAPAEAWLADVERVNVACLDDVVRGLRQRFVRCADFGNLAANPGSTPAMPSSDTAFFSALSLFGVVLGAAFLSADHAYATPFSVTGLTEPDPGAISCPERTSLASDGDHRPARFIQLERAGSTETTSERRERIVAGHEHRLKSCLEAWRVWDGAVTLSTTVTKSGRIEDVAVAVDGHDAAEITACVASHAQAHVLPEGAARVRVVQDYTIRE